MKRPNIARLILPALALTLLGAASCNDKSDPVVDSYGEDSSVAISNFKLKADANVLIRLDTVFFTIDLDNAVIFNADSLPAGTPVTDLIPVITYPESVKDAVITMTGGQKREGEFDYKKNPSDSVDFTGDVTLKLTSQDGENVRSYRLKVNVHKLVTDSLSWDNIAESRLPSRNENPVNQKSVTRSNTAYSLIRENDGSLTLSSNDDISSSPWKTTAVTTLPADVDVRSFTATDKDFYILGGDGTLWSSPDAIAWTATDQKWSAITGGYGEVALGIDATAQNHVSYPQKYPATPLEAGFPRSGFSNMGIMTTKWSVDPVALIAGGYDTDGKPLPSVWAFDGRSWAQIANAGMPYLADASLIPYTFFRPGTVAWIQTEYPVWLLTGGHTTDGNLNRDVYLSYDNGVTWVKAVDYMQLPEMIPSMYSIDGLVITTDRKADLADNWLKMPPRRIPSRLIDYDLDGYEISWKCPYIYLVGGYDAENRLCNTIWRGVLNRLVFTPII